MLRQTGCAMISACVQPLRAFPAAPSADFLCRKQVLILRGPSSQVRCRQCSVIVASSAGRANSRKGKSFTNKNRRKGRPSWQRSPDDSPLRDGNRDRVIGLLTERAARTLRYYLSETNLNVFHWLTVYMQNNPIPRDGHWDDVSGETFLRKLLAMPIEHANVNAGRDQLYVCHAGCGVDPRSIAQRIMEIRTQLAKEMTEDLKNVSEENALLMRESIGFSFSLDNVVSHPTDSADNVVG